MRIKEVLIKKGSSVVTIEEDSTMLEAVKLMNNFKIGSLLVLDNDKNLAGILTERDILQECDNHCDFIQKTMIKDIMTRDLLVVEPDDEVQCSMKLMAENKIRHLPVIENGKIAGLITIVDLVRFQLEEVECRNRHLTEYIKYG